MIKNKKIGILGLILATSVYLVGCNNNQDSSNKNSEIDNVYTLFKTTYEHMLNLENYSKGFTCRLNVEDETSMEIDNDNIDFGEVNTEGNAWGEGEKEQYLNYINESIVANSNCSNLNQVYAAYNLVSNIGYYGSYNCKIKNDMDLNTDMKYYSDESVISKDGDNDYVFNKIEHNRFSDVDITCCKQLIGDSFYKEVFFNYLTIIKKNGFGDFEFENLEQFVDALKNNFVLANGLDFSKDEVESDLSFVLEDDVYSLSVKLNWEEENSLASSEGDNCASEYIFSFVPNKYMEYNLIYNENAIHNEVICPNNDNSGVIPLIANRTFNLNWHASMDYEEEGCPTIAEDVTYEDEGKYQIWINYYIDGHYFFDSNISHEWGTEVTHGNLVGADEYFKADMQWYLDPECTIPFTAETWPCYSFNLYTNLDSLNDDYALVGHFNFEDEVEYRDCIASDLFDYRYSILKVSGDNKFDNISYAYAYLNGERIEKDEPLTFISSQTNYLAIIYHFI